jgi:hypothetical protein
MDEKLRKPPTPYFGKPGTGPQVSSAGPDVLFVDFLARLDGAARVDIDLHQEMLIMMLRARCLKYALQNQTGLLPHSISYAQYTNKPRFGAG